MLAKLLSNWKLDASKRTALMISKFEIATLMNFPQPLPYFLLFLYYSKQTAYVQKLFLTAAFLPMLYYHAIITAIPTTHGRRMQLRHLILKSVQC